MPPQLTWLHRLPDIVAQIKGLPSPVIDRSVIEQIFQVQRRQAHKLMAEFGAHQLGSGRGRTLVLTRDELVARCRLSLFNAMPGLIIKDFHAREPLKFCFIEYSFSLIKPPREPHFRNQSQRYVLDSTRLPF